jgi:hypothetical protein
MGNPIVATNDIRESSKGVLDTLMGQGFIAPHERCRADHIGVQEDSELTNWFFGQKYPVVVIL